MHRESVDALVADESSHKDLLVEEEEEDFLDECECDKIKEIISRMHHSIHLKYFYQRAS